MTNRNYQFAADYFRNIMGGPLPEEGGSSTYRIEVPRSNKALLSIDNRRGKYDGLVEVRFNNYTYRDKGPSYSDMLEALEEFGLSNVDPDGDSIYWKGFMYDQRGRPTKYRFELSIIYDSETRDSQYVEIEIEIKDLPLVYGAGITDESPIVDFYVFVESMLKEVLEKCPSYKPTI